MTLMWPGLKLEIYITRAKYLIIEQSLGIFVTAILESSYYKPSQSRYFDLESDPSYTRICGLTQSSFNLVGHTAYHTL